MQKEELSLHEQLAQGIIKPAKPIDYYVEVPTEPEPPKPAKVKDRRPDFARIVLKQWAAIHRGTDHIEIQKITGALRKPKYRGCPVEVNNQRYEYINSVIAQMPLAAQAMINCHFYDRWDKDKFKYVIVKEYIKKLGVAKRTYDRACGS